MVCSERLAFMQFNKWDKLSHANKTKLCPESLFDHHFYQIMSLKLPKDYQILLHKVIYKIFLLCCYGQKMLLVHKFVYFANMQFSYPNANTVSLPIERHS